MSKPVREKGKARVCSGQVWLGVAALALLQGGLWSIDAALAQTVPAPTALPQNPVVVSGQVNVSTSDVNPHTGANAPYMNITQATDQAVINWGRYDIGAQAHVNYAMTGANATSLNRVMSADPSQIYGKLSANGKVILINPNGVIFGAGARVDVGALVAGTMNITDDDYLAGRTRYEQEAGSSAGVTNEGSLNAAPGGYVALLGAKVVNKGEVNAPSGKVIAAAGKAVDLPLTQSGLITLPVDPADIEAIVENKGLITAPNGDVYLSAEAASSVG